MGLKWAFHHFQTNLYVKFEIESLFLTVAVWIGSEHEGKCYLVCFLPFFEIILHLCCAVKTTSTVWKHLKCTVQKCKWIMLNELLLLFYYCWKPVNSHVFHSKVFVWNWFLFFICKPSASLHHLTQAKEDDGYDSERKRAHRRGESLSHRPHSHGNEGEVCCWEPAGQDVRDTVSFTCHINKQVGPLKLCSDCQPKLDFQPM